MKVKGDVTVVKQLFLFFFKERKVISFIVVVMGVMVRVMIRG